MFSDVTFHIESFSTDITFTTLSIWIFTWKRHLTQCNVKSVKIFQEEMRITEHLQKNHLFFVLVWWFPYFRHLLQNPNLILLSSITNNHYWAYAFLNPWALTDLNVFCSVPVRTRKHALPLSCAFWLGHFPRSKISFESIFLIKCFMITDLKKSGAFPSEPENLHFHAFSSWGTSRGQKSVLKEVF